MTDNVPIHLAVEDALSEAVLRVLLARSKRKYSIGKCFSRGGSGYLIKSIRGFNHAAQNTPFLMLADLDRVECAPELIRKWLPIAKHPNFLFRIAVREVEAWLLADRENISHFLGISQRHIPQNVEVIDDPKRLLIQLAKKSRYRTKREAIVPAMTSSALIGPDYNGCLIAFVQNEWDIAAAQKNSPRLQRAIVRLANFQPHLPQS